MVSEQNSPASTPSTSGGSGLKVLLIVGIIIVLLGLMAGGGYIIYKKFFAKSTTLKSVTIPENCPKNIPIYPKSIVVSVTCKPDASSIESVINIKQKTVKDWYKAEVPKAGWTIRGEDTASYLFDNDNNEIGKVSLSTEKKNTTIKFLVAKKNAQAPSSAKKSSKTANRPANLDSAYDGIFDSLVNWDDYFNSVSPDFSQPIDEIVPGDWDVPAEEIPAPEEEAPPEETAAPEETALPEEIFTPEPEITEAPDEPTEPNCWVDDKGGTYCE